MTYKKLSHQDALQRLLAASKIPHVECRVYGKQLKIVTLRAEYRDLWVKRITKIATITSVEACHIQPKKPPGAFVRPAPVEAFKIIAVLHAAPAKKESTDDTQETA